MAHSWAIELIRARTGRCCSRGTITNARVWLTGRGIVEADIGLPWAESKGKTVSTIYRLLPEHLSTELALCARTGLVQFAAAGMANRPAPLSAREQQMLAAVMAGCRVAKAEAKRERLRQEAAPDPVLQQPDPSAEFEHLIDV